MPLLRCDKRRLAFGAELPGLGGGAVFGHHGERQAAAQDGELRPGAALGVVALAEGFRQRVAVPFRQGFVAKQLLLHKGLLWLGKQSDLYNAYKIHLYGAFEHSGLTERRGDIFILDCARRLG